MRREARNGESRRVWGEVFDFSVSEGESVYSGAPAQTLEILPTGTSAALNPQRSQDLLFFDSLIAGSRHPLENPPLFSSFFAACPFPNPEFEYISCSKIGFLSSCLMVDLLLT